MHQLDSKFCTFTSSIQQKVHTYLLDLQHFSPGNGSISVLVIKPKWPAQLLHRRAFDEHADGHDILPELNHPILRKSNIFQTHWPLVQLEHLSPWFVVRSQCQQQSLSYPVTVQRTKYLFCVLGWLLTDSSIAEMSLELMKSHQSTRTFVDELSNVPKERKTLW